MRAPFVSGGHWGDVNGGCPIPYTRGIPVTIGAIQRQTKMASPGQIRILIADDSPMVRRQLRRLIESRVQGAQVEEAENGREAIEKVCQARPAVAILDIAMPELNGLLAAERISLIAPDLPIIVHTMYATPQIEREVMKRGAKALIAKDDARALITAVERCAASQFA